MFLNLIVLAWAYVVLMMAAAEAVSPQGSWLGALVTLLLYGALPLSIVGYILATPARKRPGYASRRMQAAMRPAGRPRASPRNE